MKNLTMAILSATGTARKRVIPAVINGRLCDIVAIHGRDEHRLAALAEENSIPHYFGDARKMLDQTKPDFAFVGSPPFLHEEHIKLCVETNTPILCEKPLCVSVSEAATIQDLVATSNIPFRLAHHLRHQPGMTALRSSISDATHGKLLRVAMQWGFWLNESSGNAAWKLDPFAGGPDAFYDAGVHAIDLMLHLLPRPRIVTAIGQRGRFQATVDNVSALLLCGDVIVELSASQSSACALNSLTLDFEHATISIPHALSEASFTKAEIISPSSTTTREFDPVDLYGKEVEDFVTLLKGGVSVGTTIDEACRSVHILRAITESHTTGQMISLQ
jgi:predicted dehydrogenase